MDCLKNFINQLTCLGMSLIIAEDFLSSTLLLSLGVYLLQLTMSRKIIHLNNIYVCLYNVIILILVDVLIFNQ